MNKPETRTRTSDRETVRQALIDAIGWSESLADAYRNCPDDPARADALEMAKRYRSLLRRRYKSDRTPFEQATDNLGVVSIFELPGVKLP